MIDVLLKITLSLITLGIGFSVSKDDLIEIFKKPRALAVGLFTQMIFLPLVAIGICLIFSNLSIPLKIGIVIIALCPGGTTANLLSYLFKANVSLSISLTSINGLLTLITIPLFTKLAIG